MITEQTLLLMKPQQKPFFLIFQSETCCKLTLVTRYYSGKVSCHAIELLIDYEHRYLTTCNSIQVQSQAAQAPAVKSEKPFSYER